MQIMADYGDRYFDPATGLLCRPEDSGRAARAGYPGVASPHPVRESLDYALVLLELSERSLQGRAGAIIGRVVALPEPDFAPAVSNAMTLIFIRQRHGRRLAAQLVNAIEHVIGRAAACVRHRNEETGDAGMAMKGVFVMLAAAEAADDADLLGYALSRLGRLRDTMPARECFSGEDGPARAAACLTGLHAVDTYVKHAEARVVAGVILERLWQHVAGMEGECGALGLLIEKAGREARSCTPAGLDGAFDALYACVLNVDAPGDVGASRDRRKQTMAGTAVLPA